MKPKRKLAWSVLVQAGSLLLIGGWMWGIKRYPSVKQQKRFATPGSPRTSAVRCWMTPIISFCWSLHYKANDLLCWPKVTKSDQKLPILTKFWKFPENQFLWWNFSLKISWKFSVKKTAFQGQCYAPPPPLWQPPNEQMHSRGAEKYPTPRPAITKAST